ncbi:MAG: PTS system fructose subfamily IIA component [Ghiorsea sp.]|nr:PTS system fructose subfamily IIA component [Ghiorsea sp.]
MIGILLVAHANIASENKAAIEHILGEQQQFAAIDIYDSAVSTKDKAALAAAMMRLDDGQGVLVLVDLLGATPWNVTCDIAQHQHAEVISGFNLPAVIKAVSLRQETVSLAEVAQACVQAGQHYMRMYVQGET